MKILLCMDSWKGSLSAEEACERVKTGIVSVIPDIDCELVPLADGGEGTQALIAKACPGEIQQVSVQGPLEGMQIHDGYLYWPDRKAALIEMALCAGLPLLRDDQRDPLVTTTYGVGQWMQDAIAKGCTEITLAVGGSATVDGGMGMAQAMGWQFLDAAKKPLGFGGGELAWLSKIVPPEEKPDITVRVMCDVTNPLIGYNGAAEVFGPQKGADDAGVAYLKSGLSRLAERIEWDLKVKVAHLPGGGAAGGIAAGAVAYFGATLVSGVEEMMRLTQLDQKIQHADWVITGEGRVDSQSLEGKVLSGVLWTARQSHTKVGVIAGSCELSESELESVGLHAALAANDQGLPIDEAMKMAGELAEAAGRRFAQQYLL